jgi:hypothetical protein
MLRPVLSALPLPAFPKRFLAFPQFSSTLTIPVHYPLMAAVILLLADKPPNHKNTNDHQTNKILVPLVEFGALVF